MTNLFDLAEGLIELMDVSWEDTDEDLEGWQKEAEELLQGEIADKLDACAGMVRHLEGCAELVSREKQRFGLKESALKKRAVRLKRYMVDAVKALPQEKRGGKMQFPIVRGTRYSVSVQKNQQSLDQDLVELSKLPAAFVKTRKTPMAREILAFIKKTGEIPKGCEDALTEGGWSARIR